jgi:hypothetical protein
MTLRFVSSRDKGRRRRKMTSNPFPDDYLANVTKPSDIFLDGIGVGNSKVRKPSLIELGFSLIPFCTSMERLIEVFLDILCTHYS